MPDSNLLPVYSPDRIQDLDLIITFLHFFRQRKERRGRELSVNSSVGRDRLREHRLLQSLPLQLKYFIS